MMGIRRTFLVLVVPLFLLLAAVNGALLFYSERSEAAQGLESQALAAAVTTAAFAAANDDLAKAMAAPQRDAALRHAAASIRGLDGLYVVAPGQPPQRIAGEGDNANIEGLTAPTRPVALPIRTDAEGHPVATALAPADRGRFVIAQIDAAPLFAQVAGLKRLIAGLIVLAGAVGLVLAWVVASRITRELARNSAMIEAIRTDGPTLDVEGLAIRETRDLANAVRLMRTSVAGRVARGDRELAARDRLRDEAGSVDAYRETAFAPLASDAGGQAVAVRMLGDAPAGSFYALAARDGRGALVLGECAGDTPATALARALAARRYFERRMLEDAAEHCVARGREAFVLSRVVWRTWSEAAPPLPDDRSLALLDDDNAARAAAYVRRGAGLAPVALRDDLAVLLDADGVLAILGPASAPEASAQGGEG